MVARHSVIKRFHFTKKRLDALPPARPGSRSYYYDDTIRGLAIAVSPLGKKTFTLYRKVLGKPERVPIGPYPDLSIEQARGRAEEMNGAIARGENPGDKRRAIRDEATLGEAFETFLEYYAKLHKKSWKDDQWTFNRHLASWKLRRLSSIKRADVVILHARIGRVNGPYMANRVVELISGLFNRAREWGWVGENPASKVRAFREPKRERFLQADELPSFFNALTAELNETVRDFFFLCLFTGARRSNVQSMRWDEIDFDTSTWTIPDAKSKSGEIMRVVLSPPATKLLHSRRAGRSGPFVFPGKGARGHLVEPKSAWKRILKRAAITDLRLHDLRRTLGSWQAATGASLPIIGKSLGHKDLGTTQIYARLNLDPVREAVNIATTAMLIASKKKTHLLSTPSTIADHSR